MAYKFLVAINDDVAANVDQIPDELLPPAVVIPPLLPDQAIYPSLTDDGKGELILEPSDGPAESVVRTPVAILGYGGPMHGMPAEAVGKLSGELYVTSARVVFVGRNFDHGVGTPFGVVKAVTKVPAHRRSGHRFIAAQLRYPWLGAVGVQTQIRFSAGEGLLMKKNALRLMILNPGHVGVVYQFACEQAVAVADAILARAMIDKIGIDGLTDEQRQDVTSTVVAARSAIAQARSGEFVVSAGLMAVPRKKASAYRGAWSARR